MAIVPTDTPWGRLHADVKIDIPGVTDAVFQQVLYRTWKDFCDATNIWLEEVPIDVVPSTTTYPFSVSHKGAPNRLLMVYDPALALPNKRWIAAGITMPVPGVVNLTIAPSQAAKWNVIVAKAPVDPVDPKNFPALEAPDQWIVDKYREALYFGTLGRLQASPSKPYTNPTLGAYNLKNYRTERGKARTDAIRANVFGGQNWSFPQSFATVNKTGWV